MQLENRSIYQDENITFSNELFVPVISQAVSSPQFLKKNPPTPIEKLIYK